jgi:amino acid adenylation domain-containing protein
MSSRVSVLESHETRDAVGRFLERCAEASAAPALAWSGGSLTYGELRDLSFAIVAQLDSVGVGVRARVAVHARRSPETIALTLACMISARPVLLVPCELRAAAVSDLLAAARVDRVCARAPLEADDLLDARAGAVAKAVHAPRCASDIALMLTTSGSTGFPKIVPLSHGALARFADWASARFEIAPGAVVLNYSGLSFDLSILEVWTTLMSGGCAVLVTREQATQGEHLLELITGHRVDVLQGVPMLYGLLLEAGGSPIEAVAENVRHAILTGDVMPAKHLSRLPRLLPNARLHNVYGCTETNDSLACELDAERLHTHGALPLGRPLPGVSALIVDEGSVVDGAGVGELWVSTPFQARGYLGRSSSREAAFVADPLGRSRRAYFRSGDLVRRDAAGDLFLEGRSDLQIKTHGVRINLAMVEQAILEAPDVSEAAVIALDDALVGKRLHALVRGHGAAGVDTLELRRRCARRLTRLAIPPTIELRSRPLPRTATGKLDRESLTRTSEAEMDTLASVRQYIVDEFAPDIDADALDADYDLLESGIVDSLGLLTILAWIEEQFALTLDVAAIVEDDFRCVRAICSLIDGGRRTGTG